MRQSNRNNRLFQENYTPKGWVSIDDYLPRSNSEYRVLYEDNSEGKSFVKDSKSWYNDAINNNITHWYSK